VLVLMLMHVIVTEFVHSARTGLDQPKKMSTKRKRKRRGRAECVRTS
jgi:hypothetical protein